MCFLGEGYWLAGEDDKARQTLEEGLEMAERYGVRYELGFAHRLLGEISLKNRSAQAAPHFEKSIAIFQEIKAENELFERLATPIEPNNVREVLAELPEA
jgi:hypothetical protein